MTWIAVIAELLATSADGAGVIAFAFHLLPFVSSAFVPTATMPEPVRVFAENQPVTSVVDVRRALLSGTMFG